MNTTNTLQFLNTPAARKAALADSRRRLAERKAELNTQWDAAWAARDMEAIKRIEAYEECARLEEDRLDQAEVAPFFTYAG